MYGFHNKHVWMYKWSEVMGAGDPTDKTIYAWPSETPSLNHCRFLWVAICYSFMPVCMLIRIDRNPRWEPIDRNPRWGTTNFHHSSMPTPRVHVERQNEQFEFNNKPGIAWGWYRGSGQSPFYWIPSLGVLNLDPVDVFNELLELSIGLISHRSICIWGPQSDESYKGLSCGTLI